MYWQTALATTAEVAIGIAGFSAIFAAVERRGPGPWHSAESLTLSILLMASASAIFASLLPFLLLETGFSVSSTWATSSALYGAWMVGISSLRMWQSERLGARTARRLASVLSTTAIGIFLLFNAAWLRSSWPYLIGVYWQLVVAFIAFFMLLRGVSIPDRDDE